MMSEIEIAYADSPLSSGSHAGDRLAPEHYDGPPPGSGSEPRFVLYAADSEKALASQFPSLLEPTPRKPDDPDRLLIVRPDGYIGFSSDHAAWNEAERYLQQLAPKVSFGHILRQLQFFDFIEARLFCRKSWLLPWTPKNQTMALACPAIPGKTFF